MAKKYVLCTIIGILLCTFCLCGPCIIQKSNLLFFSRCPKTALPWDKHSKIFAHLSKKLEGRDFSFRNEASFCKCGLGPPLHIQRRILSYFYWVAPNNYDVFLIILTRLTSIFIIAQYSEFLKMLKRSLGLQVR